MKKKNKGINNLEKKMTADDIVTDKIDTSIRPRDKNNRTLK